MRLPCGFGMMFWKNTDPNFLIYFNNTKQTGYNFVSFGNIGLGYKFSKNRKKSNKEA
jgi:hypothetical protein